MAAWSAKKFQIAPGNAVDLNPEGVGGLLRAGSTLNLQMQYTTSGKETTDETEIGIYFYPEGYVPDERMGGGVGNAFSINIPAQAKDHEMQLVTYVPEEAEIFSLMPHMHFRGKRMSFTAQYPDGGEELLLSKSASKSFLFSIPTDRRIRLSVTPTFSRSSFGMEACVMEAG